MQQLCLCAALEYLHQGKSIQLTHPDDALNQGNHAALGLNLEQLSILQGFVQGNQDAAAVQVDPGFAAFRLAGGLQPKLGILLNMDMLIAVGIQCQAFFPAGAHTVGALEHQAGLGTLGRLVRMYDFTAAHGLHLDFPGEILGVDFLRRSLL